MAAPEVCLSSLPFVVATKSEGEARTWQNPKLCLGDSVSISMLLLMANNLEIRNLVVNEARRTLAIWSGPWKLVVCVIGFPIFIAKLCISKELNSQFQKLEHDKAFRD